MKKIFVLLIVLLNFQVFGASKNKVNFNNSVKMPEWILNPTSVYSQDDFLVWVGEGIDKNSAELSAISGIASIFEQKITSSTSSSKTMIQAKKEGKIGYSENSSINQDILRTVDAENLICVEIKEYWTDEKPEQNKEQKWYCIAVIERKKAIEIYNSIIEKNIKEINKLLNVDKTNWEKLYSFETIARLEFAKEVAQLNKDFLTRLQIINFDASKKFDKKMIEPNKIAGEILQIKNSIPIFVSLEDSENSLSKTFIEVLSNEGYKISSKNERYSLTGKIDFKENKMKSGTFRWNYQIFVSLKDFNNDILVEFSANGRESMTDSITAKNRAIKSARSKIEDEFGQKIKEYLDSLISY